MRISVIGGGGKSTACLKAAKALADRRVLLTTTTHIYPVMEPDSRVLLTDPGPAELLDALEQPGIVCAGTRGKEGKLASLPEALLRAAMERADVTICEADGSRHHPLKLHRPHEPVIPEGTDLCLVVAGLSALGRPVCQAVHCYGLNPAWKAAPERLVGMEEFLFCVRETIRVSGQSRESIMILLNQVDVLSDPAPAHTIQETLRSEGFSCQVLSLDPQPDQD